MKTLWDDFALGIVFGGIILLMLVLSAIRDRQIDHTFIQVDGQVESYIVTWTDTGMDWEIDHDLTFYIPTEQRFVSSWGEDYLGVVCPIIHWGWFFQWNCPKDYIPDLKIGEEVTIKYNPKDNSDIVWSYK